MVFVEARSNAVLLAGIFYLGKLPFTWSDRTIILTIAHYTYSFETPYL